jgi:trigger factor
MATVTTTTTDLGDSRVKVEVEVPATEIERELASAAGEIGRDMKVPGFRKGKVPPQVVLQQVGRAAVLDEAVRRGLPAWYEDAITDSGITPVGNPNVDLNDLPEKGAPLAFHFEVGVRPEAKLGKWKGVEVGRREPQPSDDEVNAEIERARESLASLETVERAAAMGDFVVMDFAGSIDGEPFEGGEARAFPLELGSNRLIEGFEEQLVGASAGDEPTVTVTFPDDYQADQLAGKTAEFAVTVKEVKEKRLPELDDDFAVEAGGYDSLDELRGEIAGRIREAQEAEIEREFREAVVDTVAQGATIEVPKELVHAKAHEMWHVTSRRLQQQGLQPEQYLQIMNKTEEELVTESEPDAERALRRESVLAAMIEAEQIEVSDEEMLEALREAAAQSAQGQEPPTEDQLKRSLEKAREQGADVNLREDIAMRKAVDLIVENAKAVSVEQAKAKKLLWTPEKEEPEAGASELWTPGD